MTLEERIDAVESRAAIADLIHTYARHIRRDEPDQVAALFLPGGWFEIRDGHPSRSDYTLRDRYEGREGVHAHLAPNKGKPHPVPLIRNMMIEVSGDEGTANSVMDAQVTGTQHRVQGEYRDVLQRVDGRWYFASRTYTIFRDVSTV